MLPHPVSTLLISNAGPVQEGLKALLSTLPGIRLIDMLPRVDEILKVIEEQRPRMIVLDTDLRNSQLEKILQDIRAHDHRAICIVIVHEANQKQIAENAGADIVQLSGFPAGELAKTIERLLDEPFFPGEAGSPEG